MKKSTSYDEKDIQLLSDREHVRLRIPVYAGSTSKHTYQVPIFFENSIQIKEVEFIPAVYKCVNEIIDNCIDEHEQTGGTQKNIKIEANPILGIYKISDNGRGVPIGKHETGKYTPEVVFGSLRSGRNFKSGKTAGVIGMNGMGSSIVNYCSDWFKVEINRDNKVYKQTFTNGANDISDPVIKKGSDETGTSVEFQLDSDIFDDITLPLELIRNRAIEISLTNPGVAVQYNNEKFRFRKGFDDIVKVISNNEYYKFESENMEFYVVHNVYDGIDEQMFSWVNSSLLFDGGICNTQFLNAFYDKTINHLASLAKKNKCEVTKNDIRQNLLIFGNLKISDPEYDAQSKTRLTGPNLRIPISKMVDDNWAAFARKHKDWFTLVLEHAIIRHNVTANKNALKAHKNTSASNIKNLKDATSRNRSETKLIVTEGLSASRMITQARDPKTTASLPLTGKINNVYGQSVANVLKMGKVSDLLSAIGLVPGVKAIRSDLRYGEVWIATDADYDGDDIFVLLVNLFYQFWPELLDPKKPPFLRRLIAPNVVVSKGKNRIHFPSLTDYKNEQTKYKTGYTVEYMKGLGSMCAKDWKMILSGESDTLIPVVDDGIIGETMTLLFCDNNIEQRKEWLQNE